MRNGMRLGALIAFEVAAVAMLHALGDLPWMHVPPPDPSGWARWAGVTPAEDVLAAVARVVALAGAYWLLVSTLCYTAAAAARLPGALRVAGWATLPAVRRVADRALAVALVTSSVVGASSAAGGFHAAAAPAAGGFPAAAASAAGASVADSPSVRDAAWPPFPPLPPAHVGTPQPQSAAPSPPADQQSPSPPSAAPSPPSAAPSPPVDAGPPPPRPAAPSSPADGLPEAPPPDRGATSERPRPARATHVVEPGESLWTITVTHLEAGGADLDPAAVRAVWREVVDANRDRLRSGDPDLIYPGETVTLSPLPEYGPAVGT